MWLNQYLVAFGALFVIQRVDGRAFLYNPSQAIATFLSSSSIASSQQQNVAPEEEQKMESNIVDLRVRERSGRLVQDEKIEQATTEQNNEVLPDLVQKKIAKILRKLQFLASVGKTPENNNEERDLDDFDAEFENINVTEGALDDVTIKEEKDMPKLDNNYSLGLYFLELVGSIFGLAYGAAVQFQEAHRTTTASPYTANY